MCVRVCVCVIVGSYTSDDLEQSQEEKRNFSSLFSIFAVMSAAAAVYLYHTVFFFNFVAAMVQQ